MARSKRRTLSLDGYRAPKGVKSWYRESSGWHIIFSDETRRPKSKWVRLDTHADPIAAQRFIEKAQAYDLGTFDPWAETVRPVTVQEALESFLGADPRLRESTRVERRQTIELFAADLPGGGDLALRAVRPKDVRAFIYRKSKPRTDGTGRVVVPARELSSSTRAGYYARLRTFFRWAVKAKLIPSDPTAEVERPRVERKVPAYLTEADLDRLLAAYHMDRDARGATWEPGALEWFEPIVLFAVNTGMRLGEITALRWRDVDLGDPEGDARGRVYVRNYERADGTARRTKTGGERSVPISTECRGVLLALQAERGGGEEASGETALSGDTLVFRGLGGGPLDDGRVSRTFRKYRKMAKLDTGLHFHSLRHTCASWLVSHGADLRLVQDILGHTSIRSTEIYSHLLPGASDRAVDAMDRARTSVARPEAGGPPSGTVSIEDLSEADRDRLLQEILLERLQKS